MIKNANEVDINQADNEKIFQITKTNNFKNNINISINKINPSFENSNTNFFKFYSRKANSKKNNIYSDLSKYLKHPILDLNSNYLNDKNESFINNSIFKNLISPGKIKLEPLYKREFNNEKKIKFNSFSKNYENNNAFQSNREENFHNSENKDKYLEEIDNKQMKKNQIKYVKENKETKIYMSKNLKLKKYAEHPFNKYLKIDSPSNSNSENVSFDNREFCNNSRFDNSKFSDKCVGNDNKENNIGYIKINKKNDKNSVNSIDNRKNKLRPIAISNKTAIKNISNLVYDLMEKNNVVQSISNLFDNESTRFKND